MTDQIPPSPLSHSREMEAFSGKLIGMDAPFDAERLDATADKTRETPATDETKSGLLALIRRLTESVPEERHGVGDGSRIEKKLTIDEGDWGRVEIFNFPRRGGIGSIGNPGKLTGRALVEVHIRKNRSDGGQNLIRIGLDGSPGSLTGRTEEYSLNQLQVRRGINPWSHRDTVVDTPLHDQLKRPFITDLALGINNPELVRSSDLKESEALIISTGLQTILDSTQS